MESTHSLVALDISDVEHPKEVSSLRFVDGEKPHWISMDPTGKRIVMNSGGGGSSNRLYMAPRVDGNGGAARHCLFALNTSRERRPRYTVACIA